MAGCSYRKRNTVCFKPFKRSELGYWKIYYVAKTSLTWVKRAFQNVQNVSSHTLITT